MKDADLGHFAPASKPLNCDTIMLESTMYTTRSAMFLSRMEHPSLALGENWLNWVGVK